MSEHVLYLATIAVGGGTIAAAVRSWPPPGQRRTDPPRAGLRTDPVWAPCPVEGRDTPHSFDAGGVRRCRVCKATTKKDNDDA
ncbi:hypothetical protein HUT18_11930 [Streptomyces sp. NA04227]|uniref:hypothetical protein n=1 Tax=Streptomyces sp. NA04227 TaxID=2742136 RepID=UPI00159076CB|nr:hypothetical protein [Streptomyces sp. NA04227]QKW07007.1 hypothetical protein HUT18_11930 [Streptomyces sp. NA04227]